MMEWITNPEANYVLAAYGIAAVALIGLLVASLCEARKRAAAWARVKQDKQHDA